MFLRDVRRCEVAQLFVLITIEMQTNNVDVDDFDGDAVEQLVAYCLAGRGTFGRSRSPTFSKSTASKFMRNVCCSKIYTQTVFKRSKLLL